MYNLMVDSELPDRYPMNQLSDMWTNFIGVVFGCIVLAIGVRPMFLIMQLFLCLMEVLGHIVKGGRFMWKNYGKVYNPGLATTILGYIPIASGILTFFFNVQAPSVLDIIGGLVCGLVLGGFALKGAEELCKSKDTLYAYDWGDGYFERFKK